MARSAVKQAKIGPILPHDCRPRVAWDAARGLPQVISDGSTTYVYGLDLISKTAAGGARRYFAQDGLGSTVALSNNSGTGVGTASYWGYGEQRTSTGESAAPFEFAGEQRDASTGMHYLRARYYDPDSGRFITKDPWGGSATNPLTQNGFMYALGNPALMTDPSGMCPFDDCGALDAAWDAVTSGVSDIADGVADTAAAVYPSIAEVAGNAARDTVDAVTDATRWLKNSGCLDAALAGVQTYLAWSAGPLATPGEALLWLGNTGLAGVQFGWQPSLDYYEGDSAHRYDSITYKVGVGLDTANLVASLAPLAFSWGPGVALGVSGAVAVWNGGQCAHSIAREAFGIG